MTNNQIRIRTLVNNEMPEPLLAEHGLSLWIEYAGKNILFDTGQSDILIANANTLNIDLAKTDIIILSHGHYDHTGGLAHVLNIATQAKIYLHPQACKKRYSCHEDKPVRDISIPKPTADNLNKLHDRICYTDKHMTIHEKINITGQIPRNTAFEDTGGPFFLETDKKHKDLIEDDMAMYINTPKGIVVIVGCAHSGIINTLDHICSITRQNKIYAVIGGMHLSKASPNRIDQTLTALENYNIEKLFPMHCTGSESAKIIKHKLGNSCHINCTEIADITI